MKDLVAGHLNLLRLHTAGFEGLAFVLGPLMSHRASPGLVGYWFAGVLINGYIFALNDLVDLPRDRLDPARARSPLVTGVVSERVAVLYSVILPLSATLVVVAMDWPAIAAAAFVSMLILGALVNVYQKATPHPLAMDLLFATTMAAPLPVTAQAAAGGVRAVVWAATALLFLASLQLNSVAGNLKDLGSDLRTGFRTVAVAMGARIGPDGTLVPGRTYARYCWSVSGLVALSGAVLVTVAAWGRPVVLPATAAAIAVLCVVGGASLRALLAGLRRPSPRGQEIYFAAGFLLLLIGVALCSPVIPFSAAIIALFLWEGAFALYWRWYWDLRRAADRSDDLRTG
ncbi:UbiA family prenyltransferase [Actinomadura scrupuli]|uniref:UbiA family prenyltransferase n=1 Tax=Actinomadura scrupuli TaxID=559629 RepID=UPI003D99EA8D